MKLITKAAEKGFSYELLQGAPDCEITALCYDSRKVTEGCLFVCLKGANFDSHSLIAEIAGKGAAAIVIEHDAEYPEGITVIRVKSSRIALAELAAAWFDWPAEKMKTIGITGTKGKTTTTHMLKEILEADGAKVGIIGTNGITIGSEHVPTKNTTPESYELQAAFRRMYDAGCTHMVMEVSSQGLMLHRTAAIRYDIGIFLNISPDHIGPNEHESFEEYLMWKSKLFSQCRIGLVNIEDPHAEYILVNEVAEQIFTFSTANKADFGMEKLCYLSENGFVGLGFEFRIKAGAEKSLPVRVGMPGRFNADNALAALSAAALLHVSDKALETGLEKVRVNGRMEIVYSGDFTVLVDYAHNAVSTEALLDTLREYEPKRLVVVFGCGGNRAKDRRYSMGEIAGLKADLSIVTEDNSRFEKAEDIIADIVSRLAPTGGAHIEIPDRREAIMYAVMNAQPGDMIAIIGKGHEDYQEVNGVRHHFLDREEAEKAVAARFGK